MELQAGLRASTMLNLSQRFYLHGKFYLDPRINLRWSFPKVSVGDQKIAFEVGGGAGWHTMTPSLNYLYPNPIYSDWQQLNYYHTNPDYRRLNLKTYRIDPTNYTLRAARNFKWEVRGDILWGKSGQDNRLTITYFREDMTSGYRSQQSVPHRSIPTVRRLPASILRTLTAPPQLEDLPLHGQGRIRHVQYHNQRQPVVQRGHRVPVRQVNAFPSLKTRITIDASVVQNAVQRKRILLLPGPPVSTSTENRYPYMGHYNDPEGYLRNSFNTRFMFDTTLSRQAQNSAFPSARSSALWLYTLSIRSGKQASPSSTSTLNGEAHPVRHGRGYQLFGYPIPQKHHRTVEYRRQPKSHQTDIQRTDPAGSVRRPALLLLAGVCQQWRTNPTNGEDALLRNGNQLQFIKFILKIKRL